MDNNDILRRLRYTFDMSEGEMAAVFAHSGATVPRQTFTCWLKREDDPEFVMCRDKDLARFLNGFIMDRRGKRPGPLPKAEKRLTNNTVLLKLKIALDLRSKDILEILALAGLTLGKSELSAFFRRPGHRHFRPCRDQVLRNFLTGLQRHHRPGNPEAPTESPSPQENPWAQALKRTGKPL